MASRKTPRMMLKTDKDMLHKSKPGLMVSLQVPDSLLLAHLVSRRAITPEDDQTIKAEKIPHRMADKLLEILLRGDDNTIDKLVYALWESGQKHVAASYLRDPEKPDDWDDWDDWVPATSQAVKAKDEPEAGPPIILSCEQMNIVVEPCTPEFYNTNKDNAYPMNNYSRGEALIISVPCKGHPKLERKGTEVDCINLQNMLQKLHIDVKVRTETAKGVFKTEDIKKHVEMFATDCRKDSQCVVLALLAHGHEGDVISGTDGKTVPIQELINFFKVDGHPLKDKPKIIITTACRGTEKLEVMPMGGDRETDHTIICSATQDGYVSWSRSDTGSPFITALVDVIQEHACDKDILDMLKMVRLKVLQEPLMSTDKKTGEKAEYRQVTEWENGLDQKKKLYFFPGFQEG